MPDHHRPALRYTRASRPGISACRPNAERTIANAASSGVSVRETIAGFFPPSSGWWGVQRPFAKSRKIFMPAKQAVKVIPGVWMIDQRLAQRAAWPGDKIEHPAGTPAPAGIPQSAWPSRGIGSWLDHHRVTGHQRRSVGPPVRAAGKLNSEITTQTPYGRSTETFGAEKPTSGSRPISTMNPWFASHLRARVARTNPRSRRHPPGLPCGSCPLPGPLPPRIQRCAGQ